MKPEETLFAALATAATAFGRKLTREEWLLIAGDFFAKNFPKGKRAKKSVALMTDEEWVETLEHEPALAGVDIRREIGKAQFWAKNNNRKPTRRFLINWLNKAERVVGGNFARDSSRKLTAPDVYIEPAGWEIHAETLYPGTDLTMRKWPDIPTDVRAKIIKAML